MQAAQRWALWQYRRTRALHDARTLNLQRNRTNAIIDGDTPAEKAQFAKVTDEEKAFDTNPCEHAMKFTGWKMLRHCHRGRRSPRRAQTPPTEPTQE